MNTPDEKARIFAAHQNDLAEAEKALEHWKARVKTIKTAMKKLEKASAKKGQK